MRLEHAMDRRPPQYHAIGHRPTLLCRNIRGQDIPERSDKLSEPKGLTDETADLRPVQDHSYFLLAICARQNYLYAWPDLHGLGKYFLTGGARNRHIQQDCVNLPGTVEKLDCL